MKNINNEETGLLLRISCWNQVVNIKKLDIEIVINGVEHIAKKKRFFDLEKFFELSPDLYVIKILAIKNIGFEKDIDEQEIEVEVKPNTKSLVQYNIDIFAKSSIKFKKFIPGRSAFSVGMQKTAGNAAYSAGRLLGSSLRKFKG